MEPRRLLGLAPPRRRPSSGRRRRARSISRPSTRCRPRSMPRPAEAEQRRARPARGDVHRLGRAAARARDARALDGGRRVQRRARPAARSSGCSTSSASTAPDDARSAARRVRLRPEASTPPSRASSCLRARLSRRGVGGHGDRGDGRDRAVSDRDLRQRARNTAPVGGFAVLAAILSGGYNDNYGTTDYFVRLCVTIAGAAFAILAARAMRRLAADQKRFALLRGAAEIADTGEHDPGGRRPRRRACWCPRSPTSA